MYKLGTLSSFVLGISAALTLCNVAAGQTALSPGEARQVVLLPPKGNDAVDQEINHWQARLAEKPSYSPYWERLGWAYIAKARLTQDSGYYKLAQLTVKAWVAQCGPSLDAKLIEGHIDHNLHQFKSAETIARSLIAQRQNPADYALLSDALMEQGALDEAVRACQTLSNLRPGVEAFTRIAHLRLLHGDVDGAIQAMDAAIRAGDPRDYEARAWMYSRLAGYHLLKDDPSAALALASKALDGAPSHPLALAIKGRALYSLGKYDEALIALKRASELNPIPDNQWWLTAALKSRGDFAAAGDAEKKLLRQGAMVDPRTTALFLDTHGEQFTQAKTLATEELRNRADVSTHDAVAFAFFRSGDKDTALTEIKLAVAHNSCDPRIDLHAGLIFTAVGDLSRAGEYFAKALAMKAALTPSERELLASSTATAVAARD